MPIAVLGIDLGKNSCSVAGLDMHGAVVLRRRMTRESLVAFASKLRPASWRWKRVVARTSWAGRLPRKGTPPVSG
jgi:hypothetical protein